MRECRSQRRRDSERHKRQLAEIESNLDTEGQRALSAEERILVPLIGVVVLLVTGEGRLSTIIVGIVGALLTASAAMDRPRAWLSGLIQRQVNDWSEGQLRAAGRHDLAKVGTELIRGEAHAQADDVHQL